MYSYSLSGDQWTPTDHDLSGDLTSLSWSWSISQDLFLETKLATQTSNEDKYLAAGGTDVAAAILRKQMDPRFPGDPSLAAVCQYSPRADPRCDTPGNNYAVYSDDLDNGSWHNGWILDNGFGRNEYPRDQANAALSWFAGADHEVKFGVDWQEVKWLQEVRHETFYSGPQFSATSPNGYSRPCGIAVTAEPGGYFCFMEDYNPVDMLEQGLGSADSVNENATLYAPRPLHGGPSLELRRRASPVDAGEHQRRGPQGGRHQDARAAPGGDLRPPGRLEDAVVAQPRPLLLAAQPAVHQRVADGGVDRLERLRQLPLLRRPRRLRSIPSSTPGLLPGCDSIGYNFLLRSFRPGEQFRLAEEGLLPEIDLDPYYKDEIIVGFEWQATQNWAFDAKALYWELGDMIMNTVQRAPGDDSFFMSVNERDFKRNLRALGVVPEHRDRRFEKPFKKYTALQLQFNRRFANGWALYNNLTLSKLETTGSGAWWNNTSSTYGEDLGVVLNELMIEDCQAVQVTRTVPMDCHAALDRFLGQSISTINRAGRDGIGGEEGAGNGEFGSGVDRPYIWKTFGFKAFTFGKHTLDVGGLLIVSDGAAWGRGEGVGTPTADDPSKACSRAAREERRAQAATASTTST